MIKLLERHFEIAIETPGGITKLRELILSLAMQGKLVPQNPNDEPASELFKKMEVEKKKLIKDKKRKISMALSPVVKEELPYCLPKNWRWCRLRDICHDWGQKKPDKEFTYIDVGSINNKRGVVTSKVQVLACGDAPSRARKIIHSGTVIYSTVRPYLMNIAIVEQEYDPEPICSTAFAILHPYEMLNNKYLYYYLHSPSFVEYVTVQMKGVAYPAINDRNFFSGYFPLPPFAEQKRVVAKIDELMALCDKLEFERKERNSKRLKINTAVINQLVSKSNKLNFNKSWKFVEKNFNEIYSVRENVDELKKAIFQLAVMGELASQDPKDEPASELLKKIDAEKKKLIKEGKIRSQKQLSPISQGEIPYKLPKGWAWVRLNDYGIWKSGSTPSRSNSLYYGGEIAWVKSGEVKQGRIQGTSESITKEALKNCSLDINPIGSILIAMYGANIGEVGVLEIEATTNQAVCACVTYSGIYNLYLLNLLFSMKENFIRQGAGAAQPNISKIKISNTVVPLPPFDEQKRIVDKIDQLITLCDSLEQQLQDSTTKQEKILNAVLAEV
ncbi:MAG: restriction endonuclease subunit S [PVC group bacterium]|nr:restriction endonuclease subunit S [PVC group bacterium]